MDEVDACIWQPLEVSSSGLPDSEPAGRCGHVAVSCGDGKRLVVVGGYNADGILNDVWDFDVEAREWSRINLTAGPVLPERTYFRGCAGPPPSGNARLEGDPFVYFFGGADAEGTPSNDVWYLDLENRAWRELHGGGAHGMETVPCARSNHSMCRLGEVLAVHGGESSSGSLLDDFWLFRPSTASWSEARVCPTGPRPCARSSHCLAYSERSSEGVYVTGSLVLFGGLGHVSGDDEEDGAMPLNDLWVLVPGFSSPAGETLELEDALGVDFRSGNSRPVWTLVLLDGVGPSPRSLSALSARPSGGEGGGSLFLFGGYGLVELPGSGGMNPDVEEEGGAIIMAYVDDLWRLNLEDTGGDGEGTNSSSSGKGWADEESMGFVGESVVEGRNGHTLTWCGESKLLLFGGFVGDGFDASVHVAESPPAA